MGGRVNITPHDLDTNQKVDSCNLPVDLIRSFAIILVIVVHASRESFTSLSLTSPDLSMYWWSSTIYKAFALPCVPLFVMLSGALLLQPCKIGEPIRVFLKKRFNRLAPAFAFWSIIYLAWGFYTTQIPVTLNNVIQGLVIGLFTGPYYHFWFIYLIAGLYLITPILRTLVAYKDQRILRYLIIIWFFAVAVIPILQLATGYSLNSSVFVISGWIGYFVMGAYLQTIHIRKSVLYGVLALGIGVTIFSTWCLTFPLNLIGQYYFFFDYLTANVIGASVALFMILMRFQKDWPGQNHVFASRLVRAVSANTLPIFLFHLIVMESLQRGYFGFKLSVLTLNPIVEIPLLTAATLFITLGIILVLKKVPILRKLVG